MPVILDRKGLTYLLCFVSKVKLAVAFGITPPTLRKYLKGEEPKSVAITANINHQIADMRSRIAKMPKNLPHEMTDGHPEWRTPH